MTVASATKASARPRHQKAWYGLALVSVVLVCATLLLAIQGKPPSQHNGQETQRKEAVGHGWKQRLFGH
jgi:hypothetical protein